MALRAPAGLRAKPARRGDRQRGGGCRRDTAPRPRGTKSRGNRTGEVWKVGSIDRVAKSIVETQEIEGSAAPSRARKAIRAGDVLVSTVRPNLNAVAVVPDHLDGEIASTGFAVLRPKRQGLSERCLY